ncbi:MAG: recombination protein RecR [Planctomycetota bacterium]|jgi:recombination protein RecR
MSPKESLHELFKDLPGIGTRQAERFVYFLMRKSPGYIKHLQEHLGSLHTNMHRCTESYQYFYDTDTSQTLSPLARNPERDRSILMVVAKDVDLKTIEEAHIYKGTYFVIGGLAPMIDSDINRYINLDTLKDRVHHRATKESLQEVILALPLNTEGEHTRTIIARALSDLSKEHGFKITRLGRGLSTGTELEYSDGETLRYALEGRSTE